MHVQAGHLEVVFCRAVDAFGELLVPDSVLGLWAAGIRLLHVAVAEARIDPEGNVPAGRFLPELVDHIGRTAVDVDVVFDTQLQRLRVKDIGRVDDRVRLSRGGVSGGQGAADFEGADRVDRGPSFFDEPENRQIGACLLRVADHVEGGQIVQPATNHRGVVYEQGRSELLGQVPEWNSRRSRCEVLGKRPFRTWYSWARGAQ